MPTLHASGSLDIAVPFKSPSASTRDCGPLLAPANSCSGEPARVREWADSDAPRFGLCWRAWVVVVVDRAEPEQKEVVETLPPPTITCPGRDGRVVSRFFLKDHVAERNPST